MEQALIDLLLADAGVAAIAGDRVFYRRRDRKSGLPAVVVHLIYAPDDYAMKGVTGFVDALLQIDCWAEGPLIALDLRVAVKARLAGYIGGPFLGIFCDVIAADFEGGAGEQELDREILEARVKYAA